MKYLVLSLSCVAALAPLATAQITYVDADVATNTTLADGTAYAPPVGTVSGSGTDNEWLIRPFGNGGTMLTCADEGGSSEDAPMLRTRITGLLPGVPYNIYSYWWSDGSTWRGRSASSTTIPPVEIQGYNTFHFSGSSFLPMQPLANSAVVGFEQTTLDLSFDAGGFELDGHFGGSVMIAEGNRTMYEVVLGTFTADVNGEIDVYSDDLANQGNGNRTWYDGVGYEIAPLPYGAACGTAQIEFSGVPHRTTDFSVDLIGADVNSLAVILIGLTPLPPFDIGQLGFTPGCFLNLDFVLIEAAITDANGAASWAGNFGALPTTGITPVYFQWASFDASLNVSNMTFGIGAEFHY
ncbi:MAG: hypothetical protein AB8H80_11950 [Planctomycetota bacterium]